MVGAYLRHLHLEVQVVPLMEHDILPGAVAIKYHRRILGKKNAVTGCASGKSAHTTNPEHAGLRNIL